MYAYKRGNIKMDLKEIRCGFLAEIKLAQCLIHLWDITNTAKELPSFWAGK